VAISNGARHPHGDLEPELRALIMNGLALSAAGANVIMQLSRAPVGRGVMESRVDSGSLYLHPIKRTRTTLGYLMIAMLGTQRERDALRLEVNRQHQRVVSGPDSDVEYSAFDPALQLWVAACMYRGFEDVLRAFHPPLPAATLDTLYERSSRLATTLQVPPSMWPADRDAFDAYWHSSLDLVHVDAPTRDYLRGVASLSFLPAPLSRTLGPLHRVLTTGFLPERFRSELELPWNRVRQTLFTAMTATLKLVHRRLPRVVREFPLNLALTDARRRLRFGRHFV